MNPTPTELTAQRRQREFPGLRDGFTFDEDDNEGCGGIIYFKERERIMEIVWRSSGYPDYQFQVHIEEPMKWVVPPASINEDEKREIVRKLRIWLWQQKIRSNLEPPEHFVVI